VSITNVLPLGAARRRAGRSMLFWSNLYYKILTSQLD